MIVGVKTMGCGISIEKSSLIHTRLLKLFMTWVLSLCYGFALSCLWIVRFLERLRIRASYLRIKMGLLRFLTGGMGIQELSTSVRKREEIS